MTVDRIPTYSTYIDWYGHGGLTWGISNWHTSSTSHTPLSVGLVNTPSYVGNEAIKVVGNVAGGSGVRAAHMFKPFNGIQGVTLTVSVWVYIPSGSYNGGLEMRHYDETGAFLGADATITFDQWVELSIPVTATSSLQQLIRIAGSGVTPGTATYYIGWAQITSALDDVTCDVLTTRKAPDTVYGRDAARDLAETRIGEFEFELSNESEDYTPNNSLSPLFGLVRPNRQTVIMAELAGQKSVLATGFTEDYSINASLDQQSVTVQCQDLMGKLGQIEIATELYPSIRTGDAVRTVVGLTDFYQEIDPDFKGGFFGTMTRFDPWIDSGATTLRWWAATGPALDVLNNIVDSEGPPSICQIGISGQVVFEDRLHRQRTNYSAIPAFTLINSVTTEGVLAVDNASSYDHGWKQVINQVDATYDIRNIESEYSEIWSQPGDVTWGESNHSDSTNKVFTGIIPNGYIDAQAPIQGTLQRIENAGPDETDVISGILPEEHDYLLVSGAVTLTELSPSGTKVMMTFRDDTAVGIASTVRDMSLRAKAVKSESTPFTLTDQVSVSEYGGERTHSLDLGAATEYDADAIARLTLVKNAFRRPTIVAVLRNHDLSYMQAMIRADISLLVRVTHDKWHIDELFTIESIEHSLSHNGRDHTTKLHLQQQSPVVTGSEFTFDDPNAGFNDGVFGSAPLSPSESALYIPTTIDTATTADHASLDITGNLDMRVELRPNSWASGARQSLFSKYVTSGNQRAFGIRLGPSGEIESLISADGISGIITASTATVPFQAGHVGAVRWKFTADNGAGSREHRFYTAPTIAGPYTLLGSVVTQAGAITLFNSNAPLAVPGTAGASPSMVGQIHAAELYDGIEVNAVRVANPDFSAQPSGTTSFTDSHGRVWTVPGAAYIGSDTPVFVLGVATLNGEKIITY